MKTIKITPKVSFKFASIPIVVIMLLISNHGFSQRDVSYPLVDTKQVIFYDNSSEINEPVLGEDFYGQDATYTNNSPVYQNNGDGTISDLTSGLMWQKSPDMDGDGDIDYSDKMSYEEAMAMADNFDLAGYNDWRLPTIKEMYSLIIFSGIDPSGYEGSSTDDLVPFIDTDYFDFAYGDTDAGERIIDAQMASSTMYVSTTMGGNETMFGVNFADGRIKGYPTGPMPGQTEDKQFYIMYVRENTNYGINDFHDNGNGTITDNATSLMWMQDDDGEGMNWKDALTYAENFEFANHSDWRLPNAKELQSIVDYTRAPAITNSAAIDPLFNCTIILDEEGNEDYPFYWTGTTHSNWSANNSGSWGAYVCFGEALGFMEMPPNSGNFSLLDVHGAGAQRSDPKLGDPDNYPNGHGPQGDVVRIYNYVRLVRDAEITSLDEINKEDNRIKIYPNPVKEVLNINNNIKNDIINKVQIYNQSGSLVLSKKIESNSQIKINVEELSSGVYIVKLISSENISTTKFIK